MNFCLFLAYVAFGMRCLFVLEASFFLLFFSSFFSSSLYLLHSYNLVKFPPKKSDVKREVRNNTNMDGFHPGRFPQYLVIMQTSANSISTSKCYGHNI